jgi:hypothetical protein
MSSSAIATAGEDVELGDRARGGAAARRRSATERAS